MRKKGSLELSINAIVILVLAITMLGLGIAFTKGKFSELGARIEIPEPDIPAMAGDPIVLPAKEIDVSTKKTTVFSINIFNDGNLPTTAVTPVIGCICEDVIDINPYINVQGQSITVGEDRMFKIVVDKLTPFTVGDSCLCTIKVYNAGGDVEMSQQITLKVT